MSDCIVSVGDTVYVSMLEKVVKMTVDRVYTAKEPMKPHRRFHASDGINLSCDYPIISIGMTVLTDGIIRCRECKYSKPLDAHSDGVYGLHCSLCRGEEVRNVWHKYKKYYKDYSIVDGDGFCDQGEAK